MRFCTSCGTQLQDGAQVCPNCGQRVVGVNPNPMGGGQPVMGGQPGMNGQPGMGVQPGMYARTRSRIDNIFSSLVYDKTTGSIMEFSLWCSVCLGVLLLFLATILTGDKEVLSRYTDGFRLLWLFTMLFSIGLGVTMVFRKLKPIMLFGAEIVLQLIMFITYYATVMGRFSDLPRMMDRRKIEVEGTGIIIAFFVITLLVVIGIIACSSIHFFSQINLGKVTAILSMVYSGLLFVLMVLLYFCPYIEYDVEKYRLFARVRDYDIPSGWGFTGSCFWLGSIAFLLISAAITVYTVLFFVGVIDNRKNKIYVFSGGSSVGANPQRMPAIQCVQGSYPGQVFNLQNVEFSMGSQQGVNLVIPDTHVSRTHCTVRFNFSNGMYEVRDLSTNGVYLLNGVRLQKGVYTPLQRGTIFCLGSVNQQFRLL